MVLGGLYSNRVLYMYRDYHSASERLRAKKTKHIYFVCCIPTDVKSL